MKKCLLALSAILLSGNLWAQSHKLLFKTDYGNFKVVLYDATPKHQELILQAIEQDQYKDALFNRVIENFVVQGGEHDIDIAEREKYLREDQKRRLPGEFDTEHLYHKVGVLGAGRDNNPDKASFLNQIYFIVGGPVTMQDLNELESKRNWKYTPEQKIDYLHNGGTPRLDGDYTVIGEVYEGLDVLMAISKAKTDPKDFPLEKVNFEIETIQ
ncbi:peptidylprolyl isomerase [Myroides sp. LJL115]